MSDYYCPNCYADLEMQDGFDPDKGYWTCTECGQQLFGDEEEEASVNRQFPGVVWHCDSCDAVLNNQDGFDDWHGTWTCTKCGSLNFIDENEIGGDSDDSPSGCCSQDDEADEEDEEPGQYEEDEEPAQYEETEEEREAKRASRRRARLKRLETRVENLGPEIDSALDAGFDDASFVSRLEKLEDSLLELKGRSNQWGGEADDESLEAAEKEWGSLHQRVQNYLAEKERERLREEKREQREKAVQALKAFFTPRNTIITLCAIVFLVGALSVCPDKLADLSMTIVHALYVLLDIVMSIIKALFDLIGGLLSRASS